MQEMQKTPKARIPDEVEQFFCSCSSRADSAELLLVHSVTAMEWLMLIM